MAKHSEAIQGTEKEFLDEFQKLCYSRSSWQVWADLMAAMACSISNVADRSPEHYESREKEYAQCIERLGSVEIPAKMLAIIVEALERNPEQDFLGEMYMQLNLGNHWKGQFFTPYCVCKMMSEITCEDVDSHIEKQGYLSICDPACGAGATLIAAANTMKKCKHNFQNHVVFVAQDIDRITGMMCYIQLSLLGCAGYVCIANTITKNTIDKLKTLGLTGEVRIRHSNAMAIFATEDFEICTRLVQGEYYRYQNMFKELPLHTVISRKELLDAMVRAKMCTAEKCPVKFEIAGSQLGLSIKDQTTDYHETVDLQEDISEELTIGFDARLVIETLKAFDCDNVGISLQGPKMPMIVEAEDSDFKTIVLPVAIK